MNPFLNTICQNCKARPHSIFKDLSAVETNEIDLVRQAMTFKRGEMLFKEGTFPKGLYCVEAGKIKVFQIGIDGKEQIVHLIHDGNVMGHRAIFSEDTYSCSAIAMENSNVCFIPIKDFKNILNISPKLLFKVAHLLSVELKEAEHKITQMAQQPVKDRLAEVLFDLIENYGYKDDQQTINLLIKRDDLASLVGTTRETATRLLYEWQEQKVIALEGKYIKILDKDKLKNSYFSL